MKQSILTPAIYRHLTDHVMELVNKSDFNAAKDIATGLIILAEANHKRFPKSRTIRDQLENIYILNRQIYTALANKHFEQNNQDLAVRDVTIAINYTKNTLVMNKHNIANSTALGHLLTFRSHIYTAIGSDDTAQDDLQDAKISYTQDGQLQYPINNKYWRDFVSNSPSSVSASRSFRSIAFQ